MTYKPRTQEQVRESVREKLEGRIDQLTNFTKTSFNYVWIDTYAQRFRDAELALLAAQLSGWVDYSGGPITQEDLDNLDIDNLDPEEVNQFMEDNDLDELAEIVGVERSAGEKAQGTVEFTTQSQFTTIPEDTRVGTEPDQNNEILEYRTDEEVTTAVGDSTVQVDVTASEVGSEYNTTATDVLTYLPSPPTGVQAVTNVTGLTGGEPPETNDEFRIRVKEAIFSNSGGGTAAGVEGYVRNNVDDVLSVNVKEYPGGNDSLSDPTPSPGGPGGTTSTSPFADVIVEGGENSAIEDAIDEARPVAIQHNFVRPNFVEVGITAEIEGGPDTDIETIEDSLSDFLSRLNLGETVYRDKIIQRILNASESAENITYLEVRIENEQHTYDSDDSDGDAPDHPLYKLNKGDSMEYESSTDSSSPTTTGITSASAIVNGDETELDEGTDFDEGTVDDSSPDAIEWDIGGTNPDEDESFFVNYAIEEDIEINDYEKASPSGSISVELA